MRTNSLLSREIDFFLIFKNYKRKILPTCLKSLAIGVVSYNEANFLVQFAFKQEVGYSYHFLS